MNTNTVLPAFIAVAVSTRDQHGHLLKIIPHTTLNEDQTACFEITEFKSDNKKILHHWNNKRELQIFIFILRILYLHKKAYNSFWQRLNLTTDDTLLPDRWPAETGWRPGSTPGRGRRVSRCAGSYGVSWGWCPGSGLERSPRRVPGPATSAPVVSQQCTARSRGRMLRTRTFACGGAITIRCGGLAYSIMSTIKKLMWTLQQCVSKLYSKIARIIVSKQIRKLKLTYLF